MSNLKDAAYWVQRAEKKSIYFEKRGNTVFKDIENGYKNLFSEYRTQIALFYGKYGSVNKNKLSVSYEDAMKVLSPSESRKFLTKLEKISIHNKDVDFQYSVRRLKRKTKLTRLDSLLFDMEYELHEFKNNQEALMTAHMLSTYSESYSMGVYEIQRALGGIYGFGKLGEMRIKQAMLHPWSGDNYSSRIWKDKAKLTTNIKEIITRGMIQQKTKRQMARELAKTTNSSAKNALRLVRGETTHIVESTMIMAAKDAGCEMMEISSVRDRRGVHWPIYDGQRFKIDSADAAFLTPPIEFPNCRCTLIPVFTEEPNYKKVEGEFPTFEEWS